MTTRALLPATCLAAIFAACSALQGATGEPSSVERFLGGLRERRLFELAEHACQRGLDDPELSDAARATLVIEWSITLADRAVNSPPDAREPLWQRALSVTEEFARAHPKSPRSVVVRLQGALSVLTRGELARQEAQVLGNPKRRFEEADRWLGEAIVGLEALAEEVQSQLRASPSGRNVSGAESSRLPGHRLTALREGIQYQLARAHRNQAQCHPPQSADWTNSLNRALEGLDPLAKLDSAHPLAWKSRVDEVVCCRLLQEVAVASRKLDSLLDREPPAEILLRVRAETVRLALAAGHVDQAARLLDASGEPGDSTTGADLDYAYLEASLAAWRESADSPQRDQAARWQSETNERVGRIRRSHGPYWTRRAQMLVSQYVRKLPGNDWEMLVEAAENAFHSGQFDDALATYDRAADIARREGHGAETFRLGFLAATIEHHRNRHEAAMSRYRRLARTMPDAPKAAEAHLLALYHAGQLARTSPGSLDTYLEIAQEHLATGAWSRSATVDEVRWCLGRTREHRREWKEAVLHYRSVSRNSSRFPGVIGPLERSYREWLAALEAAGEPSREPASEAAAWFESLAPAAAPASEQDMPLVREALLAAARFRLRAGSAEDFRQAEVLLRGGLEEDEQALPAWRSAANALLVCSLAGQGRFADAKRLLVEMRETGPGDLMTVLECMARLEASTPPERLGELAGLKLAVAEQMGTSPQDLSDTQRQDLDRVRAEALVDRGELDAAIEAYAKLAEESPGSGQIQEAFARLLLLKKDARSASLAMQHWRAVEKRSRSGTDRWFRAKLAVALLHDRAGNPAQAEKILRLVKIVHPEPRLRDRPATTSLLDTLDAPTRDRLERLLARCEP